MCMRLVYFIRTVYLWRKMQSKTNIYFFGMRNDHNRQAKGLWRILILWHISFCDTYVYTANKNIWFILRAMRLSNKLLGQGYVKERLKSSLRKFYGRYGDLTKQYEVPLSRMLHDILDDDHIQWHPPLIGHCTNFWPLLIWTLLPNLTFYLIVQGFIEHMQRVRHANRGRLLLRTPGPVPLWGLACVLMSRPISPELVLSPDFWISNIPRYFSFA